MLARRSAERTGQFEGSSGKMVAGTATVVDGKIVLDGVAPSDFTHVLINCDKAGPVFGAATLA